MSATRRITLGIVFLLSSASAGFAQQAPSLQDVIGVAAGKSGPTTIYVAKAFLTMDPKQPRAEAVAVRDGRFHAVGTLEKVREAAGKDAKIDRTFADKVVIAGFVEQHVHPVLAALTMNTKVISIEDWDAIDGFSPAVRDAKGYQERLKAALAAHRNKEVPFVTWGYHHYMHGELNRATLNQLAPDFPVIVWHRSCHEFFLNDAALKLTGIDAKLVAGLPRGAQEQIAFEKGHFYEQGALAVLDRLAPVLASPEAFKNGLAYTVKYYHRNGITVCCEPGGFFSRPLQDLINSAYSGDEVPFNHFFMADGKTFAARNPKDARAMVADSEQVLAWGKGRTAYLPRQVKLLSDGAIFSQLMMMKGGYTDGHKGAWIMDPPLFSHAFQGYWDAGYQIHIHNNGDAGFDVVLGELDKAMARAPAQGPPHGAGPLRLRPARAGEAVARPWRHRQLEPVLRHRPRGPLRKDWPGGRQGEEHRPAQVRPGQQGLPVVPLRHADGPGQAAPAGLGRGEPADVRGPGGRAGAQGAARRRPEGGHPRRRLLDPAGEGDRVDRGRQAGQSDHPGEGPVPGGRE